MESGALVVIGAVFALGALVLLLCQLFSSREMLIRELWRLYILEVAIVGFIILPAYLGSVAFVFAVTALALRVQFELRQALGLNSPLLEKIFHSSFTVALVVAGHRGGESAAGRLMVGGVLSVLVFDIFSPPSPKQMERMGRSFFALIYPALFLAFLPMLRNRPDGFLLVAFLYTVIESTDSFAFLAGKLIGKRKVFPILTPGKTWAGLVGGLVCGGLIGVLFALKAARFPGRFAFTATGLVLTATVLGDLTASKIKRNLGIKDFGDSTTSHGGYLDIYDSLIFASPLFYWFVSAYAR